MYFVRHVYYQTSVWCLPLPVGLVWTRTSIRIFRLLLNTYYFCHAMQIYFCKYWESFGSQIVEEREVHVMFYPKDSQYLFLFLPVVLDWVMCVEDAPKAEIVCSLSKHFGNTPPLQIEELREALLFSTKVCPIPKDARWRLITWW